MAAGRSIRVGLIGAGRIGAIHARELRERWNVDLLVSDPDTGRAEALAREVDAVPMRLDRLLVASDRILIAASTPAHPELLRAAIACDLPTFCEKPLSPSLRASARLARDIERSGVPVQLGFQRRFDARHVEARDAIRDSIGTLYALVVHSHDLLPPESFIASAGGMMPDLAIHDFDVIRWATGAEVASVHFEGAVREHAWFNAYGDVESAVGIMRLTNDALVSLAFTRHGALGYDSRWEAYGSKDSISVGFDSRTPLHRASESKPADPYRAWHDRFADAYRAELAAWMTDSIDVPRASDAVAAQSIAEAAARSLRSGRSVRVMPEPAA